MIRPRLSESSIERCLDQVICMPVHQPTHLRKIEQLIDLAVRRVGPQRRAARESSETIQIPWQQLD